MSEDEVVEIVREQAQRLGGGWHMKQNIMPVVELTTVEAAAVIHKLDRRPLAFKYEDADGKEYVLPPDKVTMIYATEGL